MTFPVGYQSLHPNLSLNFQMNRWYSWVGEPDMLEGMRTAAPRIATYADWKREFVALAERALQQGHVLRAGYYWGSADFFMRADGSEDHYVPMKQWQQQIGMLKNARSITARLFTRRESAENHCQVDNYGLALRTIVIWLDGMLLENVNRRQSVRASPPVLTPMIAAS